MVLLAAAICTKNGKALVSRQFVEMTRARIEGLLASFPKLIGSGSRQHTFIETESVRYVYQPMDKLYMVLITTKASNILEDLETLRLFSRVIPEYCKTVEEKEINEHCFELLFAFDEIVALGYRENVNLAQIRTFTDMDSHEEKVYKAMREVWTQEKEAKQKMLERAEEIRKSKIQAEKGFSKGSSQYSGGFGSSSSMSSNTYSTSTHDTPSYDSHSSHYSSNFSSSTLNSSKPNKAMKLGSNKDVLPAFIEQQINQTLPSAQPSSSSAFSSTPAINTEKVHLKADEKINLTCGKDGGVQNLEVLGVLSVRITSEDEARIKIGLLNNDTRNLQIQTNPNIDKNLFKNNSVIALKDQSKSFPIGTDVGILKWRFQTNEESEIPLTINCWPSETRNGCEVSIEYELQKLSLELNNVSIVIPLPSNQAPIVKNCDGDFQHEKYKNCIIWRIPMIDQSNSTGSFEFTVNGHANEFFPINVNFVSPKPYCDIQPEAVSHADNSSQSIKFSVESTFSVDRYEIV
ncbi:coatomer subunit delta [Brachionus plicatilis]|uniref:Coatomer subunit delta n=1 Tax=Brachionus plicatilis TaxID=10195 RepID=A0A3M7QDY6_BRAPC|nr:coatomer subunit delta [Brachionus plicatilis]